ncbi:MAG: right-handed parallel beta-helix repeat-containing protein [Casimicrobiaceae bacterium]
MKHAERHLAGIVCSLAFAAFAIPAFAQTYPRTAVSSKGLDTNTCQVTLPCRSLTAALAHTAASGEIIVLDSAGYGGTLIDKSVSITAADGIYAGVTVGATGGFVINGPNIQVLLKGFVINYASGTPTAIDIQQAGTVRLENLQISGFAGAGAGVGIDDNSSTPDSHLLLKNVTVRNGDIGLRANGATTAKWVLAENVLIESLDRCVVVNDGIELVLRNSNVWTCNTGIDARNTAGATTGNSMNVNLDRTNMSLALDTIVGINDSTRVLSIVVNDSLMNRSGGIRVNANNGASRVRLVRSTFSRVNTVLEMIGTASGGSQVTVAGSTITGGGAGIFMNGVTGSVHISDSSITGCAGDALSFRGNTFPSIVAITHSTIEGNTRGIVLDSGALVTLGGSRVVNNHGVGITRAAGSTGTLLTSAGDNFVSGNGYDTIPATPDTTPDSVVAPY